jgi:ABC-type antimicrobial peptide transport system permease subunit
MNWARVQNLLAINVRLCFNEILTNRSRTIITTLGIFLGVASLLINLAFVRAMDADVKLNMEKIGGLNLVTLKALEAITREEKMQFQHSPGLTMDEADELVRKYPYVTAVIRQKDMRHARIFFQGKRGHSRLNAAGTEYQKAYDYRIERGRWFTREEMTRRREVCVIGPRIRERVFEDVDPIGKKLVIRSIPFEVVGIIATKSRYDRRSRQCIIPYSVYLARFAPPGEKYEEIILQLKNSDYARQAKRELTWELKARHRGIKDFEVELNTDKIREMEVASYGLKIVLWSIAIISMLVGSISIMNIMFATIGDRIREIGIRKALGARREDVFAQFITEAVLVCFVGSIPGMLCGASITLVPKGVFPFDPTLLVTDYIIAVAFALMAGFVSGLFPALKAADMEPVEALRY